jgi:hypothetical protein
VACLSDKIIPASAIRRATDAPDLATALGDIILAWSMADSYLMQCVGAMLSLDDHKAKRVYYKIASFDARVKMILTLVDLFPDFKPICRHVLKLSSLSKRRNAYVHNAYLAEIGGSGLWLVDYGQALDHERRSKPARPSDMHQHADAVRRSAERLYLSLREVPPYKAERAERLRRFREAHRKQDEQREPDAPPEA